MPKSQIHNVCNVWIVIIILCANGLFQECVGLIKSPTGLTLIDTSGNLRNSGNDIMLYCIDAGYNCHCCPSVPNDFNS